MKHDELVLTYIDIQINLGEDFHEAFPGFRLGKPGPKNVLEKRLESAIDEVWEILSLLPIHIQVNALKSFGQSLYELRRTLREET